MTIRKKQTNGLMEKKDDPVFLLKILWPLIPAVFFFYKRDIQLHSLKILQKAERGRVL